MADEFAFIRDHLAPLTAGAPEAFGLRDDAALLQDGPWVVSADMAVAGVHVFPDDPPDAIARKVLRMNLSDLIAKGAQPQGYLLSIAWPRGASDAYRQRFAAGLAQDGAHYGLSLWGGDTTVSDGPLCVAITAFGRPGPGGMIRRAGAKPGDGVYVTGVIGDAYLGLRVRRGQLSLGDPTHDQALLQAYQLPEPPVAAVEPLRATASAGLDVSDGALADAGHVARESGVALRLEAEACPLSPAAMAWLARQADRDAALGALASGGDDYQTVFTAAGDIAPVWGHSGVQVTRLGSVLAPDGAGLEAGTVEFVNAAGENIAPTQRGFTHF